MNISTGGEGGCLDENHKEVLFLLVPKDLLKCKMSVLG